MIQTMKPHAAFKTVITRSPNFSKKVLGTLKKISDIVGATLGPGGHPVLLERQEVNLPPMVTKDGVTVFRSLGFEDAIEQNILELVREASVKTASDAGDGTTTATILTESFARYTHEYCEANPTVPTIQVIKKIQDVFRDKLEPIIKANSIACDLSDKGKKLLKNVAKLSANGDEELANAVMKCFDICGDDGNVTIVETSGPTSYEVEKILGFPIASGYEVSCAKYYPAFINRQDTQNILAEKPMFLLYFGRITDIQTIVPALEKLTEGWANNYIIPHNLVIIATGFSDQVLANLALATSNPHQLNIYPLVVPDSPILNGHRQFLDDVAAVTCATVFDPATNPIENLILDPNSGKCDIGNMGLSENGTWVSRNVSAFECGRYRSSIVGFCDDQAVLERLEVVKKAAAAAESKLERDLTNERAAKLTGGIAKLKVIGSSNGELKERRDRAEDAVCAVRGALREGAVIGGGWMLAKMISSLDQTDPIERDVISSALWAPIITLYNNAGLLSVGEEALKNLGQDYSSVNCKKLEEATVRDISQNKLVKALKIGILDSTPAVREALRNAISNATTVGTLGGVVVFPRENSVDKTEFKEQRDYDRIIESNPADERP